MVIGVDIKDREYSIILERGCIRRYLNRVRSMMRIGTAILYGAKWGQPE